MTTIDRQILSLQTSILTIENQIAFLKKHKEVLNSIEAPHAPYFSGSYFDFDNLSHEQVIKVMLAFPGKWEKRYNDKKVDYILSDESLYGVTIRCYNGELPPSCKLVEDGEEVIPSYTRKKYKIQCGETRQAAQPNGNSPTVEGQVLPLTPNESGEVKI